MTELSKPRLPRSTTEFAGSRAFVANQAPKLLQRKGGKQA